MGSYSSRFTWILQGTFIEGVKEEVVLSAAHALSLIAAGEGKDWPSFM